MTKEMLCGLLFSAEIMRGDGIYFSSVNMSIRTVSMDSDCSFITPLLENEKTEID